MDKSKEMDQIINMNVVFWILIPIAYAFYVVELICTLVKTSDTT